MFDMLKTSVLIETHGADRAAVLTKLQSRLGHELGIDVGMRSLLNFFMGKLKANNLPHEDDQNLFYALRENGYRIGKGWKENADFWKGILSQAEYNALTDTVAESLINESRYFDTLKHNVVRDLKDKVQNIVQTTGKDPKDVINTVLGDWIHRKVDHLTSDEWETLHDELANELHAVAFENEEKGQDHPITKKDYATWKRVLKGEAKDRGINLTRKQAFMDLAMEMLDNDPFVDMHGFSEKTKAHIAGILWHQFGVDAAKAKAAKAHKMLPKAIEDEEAAEKAECGLCGTKHGEKQPCYGEKGYGEDYEDFDPLHGD